MVDGNIYHLELWDTAGQEDYDALRPLSYPETDVFLICFSIAYRASLCNVEQKWLPELKCFSDMGVPLILVGTKMDLRKDEKIPKEWIVSKEEAEKLAKDRQEIAAYLECSALTGKGQQEIFELVIRLANAYKSTGDDDTWCTTTCKLL